MYVFIGVFKSAYASVWMYAWLFIEHLGAVQDSM